MGLRYEIEITCPGCSRTGEVSVNTGPPFTFEKIPPHYRVMQPLGEKDDIRLACSCGEIFDLNGQRREL